MMRPALPIAFFVVVSSACGAPSGQRVESARADALVPPPPAAEPAPTAAIDEPDRALPTACSDGPICTPPTDFAERLCAGVYPEVALHFFAPGTPWKRAYLQRSFKAWHVGGRGDLREVRTGEEVIIVKAGGSDGQRMQIGGQAFDALRWDGTCVSLMEDELSFRKPPAAVPANIPFKKLEPAFQSVFADDKQIEAARAAQARACEGDKADKEPGKTKCELARRQLSMAIAQSVARGTRLPPLSMVP